MRGRERLARRLARELPELAGGPARSRKETVS